ncbi:MAG: sugar kinase [Alphaproteobacteria bacterium]|nr:sugar kinase [Alphaproteobacteria bacterium]
MKSFVCVGECMIELNETDAAGAAGAAGAGIGGHGFSVRRTFGGDVLNTSVYAARALAGSEARVSFATGMGDDPFSQDMVSAWAEEGVATDAVLTFPGRVPGLYAIRIDAAGERSFYYWRSEAPARDIFRHDAAPALIERLRSADMLYFSGISLAILDTASRDTLIEAAGEAKRRGGAVAFDTNYRPRLWDSPEAAADWMRKAVSACTIALPSIEDAQAMGWGETPADIAAAILAFGCGEAVVRCGADPCLIATADGARVEVPGEHVAHPVDTTAAGDSFNGAYLAARLRGAAPTEAAGQGHATAAHVIQHRGAIVPLA